MFHSTAFTPDYRATRDALVRLVGMRVLEFTRAEHAAIGRAGGMSWIGDNSLELGEPLIPGSPQARWIEKFGSGNHSVAVQMEDVVAAVDHLREREVRIIHASNGYPYFVMFTNPRDTGGVFIEWFQGMPTFDPRWGGEMPQEHQTPIVEVAQQAWVGAVVDDPLALAARLADLLATRTTFEHPDAAPGAPRAGVSLGDCTLALYDRPADAAQSHALWGRDQPGPRASLLALRVDDLGAARESCERAGVPIVRADDDVVVLEPGPTTGGVEIAFTGSLLPGDPRTGES
jgi:4-hydroxyphenylpyruvate dioxygenase-like putative hemolysin